MANNNKKYNNNQKNKEKETFSKTIITEKQPTIIEKPKQENITIIKDKKEEIVETPIIENSNSNEIKVNDTIVKQNKYKGKVNIYALNVRTSPSLRGKHYYSCPVIKQDTIVNICDTVINDLGEKWYHIEIEDDFAFVKAEFIDLI